jgi:hypothetical protein
VRSGYFKAVTGTSICQPCPASECHRRLAQRHPSLVGRRVADAELCYSCFSDTYGVGSGLTGCQACPANSGHQLPGSSAVTACVCNLVCIHQSFNSAAPPAIVSGLPWLFVLLVCVCRVIKVPTEVPAPPFPSAPTSRARWAGPASTRSMAGSAWPSPSPVRASFCVLCCLPIVALRRGLAHCVTAQLASCPLTVFLLPTHRHAVACGRRHGRRRLCHAQLHPGTPGPCVRSRLFVQRPEWL